MRQAIIIVDCGSQYTLLIARRVREQHVYCEIVPYHELDLARLRTEPPLGIILSGGPASVYDEGAPRVPDELFALGVPVLGICYGMQLACEALGGTIRAGRAGAGRDREATGPGGEYGRTRLTMMRSDPLFAGLERETVVWMSHGDLVEDPGGPFLTLARTPTCAHAAVRHAEHPVYGLQFHPEVSHTVRGSEILRNFLFAVCGARGDWEMASFIERAVTDIRTATGETERVICGLSGGVDSSVVAALLARAIGRRAACIYVDNGFMRQGETPLVERTFSAHFATDLHIVDARERFLAAVAGVTDPEQKRIAIGHAFIRVFEDEARQITDATFLAQGTLYPDVIESVPAHGGPTATIKRHHNVGGLPEDMTFTLIEPLRQLFKDEVREIGAALGLPDEIVWRQPFPGPGLAVRILGAVTETRLAIVRQADAIVEEEIRAAGLYKRLWQAFAVLLPVQSVGVMGDARTYEETIALRLVESQDGMTADWARIDDAVLARISNRIINEVPGVNRVVYDVSSKPPATIEWE